MVDQRRGLHNPGIADSRAWIASLLGPVDPALFLRFADEQNALRMFEAGEEPSRHVVLTLPFFEVHHCDSVLSSKALNPADEGAGNRFHHCGGGHFMAAVWIPASMNNDSGLDNFRAPTGDPITDTETK